MLSSNPPVWFIDRLFCCLLLDVWSSIEQSRKSLTISNIQALKDSFSDAFGEKMRQMFSSFSSLNTFGSGLLLGFKEPSCENIIRAFHFVIDAVFLCHIWHRYNLHNYHHLCANFTAHLVFYYYARITPNKSLQIPFILFLDNFCCFNRPVLLVIFIPRETWLSTLFILCSFF